MSFWLADQRKILHSIAALSIVQDFISSVSRIISEKTTTGISSLRVTTFVSVYVAGAVKQDLLSEKRVRMITMNVNGGQDEIVSLFSCGSLYSTEMFLTLFCV